RPEPERIVRPDHQCPRRPDRTVGPEGNILMITNQESSKARKGVFPGLAVPVMGVVLLAASAALQAATYSSAGFITWPSTVQIGALSSVAAHAGRISVS